VSTTNNNNNGVQTTSNLFNELMAVDDNVQSLSEMAENWNHCCKENKEELKKQRKENEVIN